MAANKEIRGSVVRKAMMDEVANRGEHMGAALIACSLLGIGEAVQRVGQRLEDAIDRQTAESRRQWGYDKPRLR